MRSLRYLDSRPKKVEPSAFARAFNTCMEFLLLAMFFVMIFLVLLISPELEQTIIDWKQQ